MPEGGVESTARYSDPISEPGGYVGRGAVLYDTRAPEHRSCCRREGVRHLYHVTGVYEETTTGEVRFVVEDGTHTVREEHHADDLLALFSPAGFSIDPGTKPTYVLTRQHGVEDHHDLMTDGGEASDSVERILCEEDDCEQDAKRRAWVPTESGEDDERLVCVRCAHTLTAEKDALIEDLKVWEKYEGVSGPGGGI